MKKKILVLWGTEFTHFCISYHLQKKLDIDFYAIIDSPTSLNDFFEKQSLINVTKKWYLHSHISKNFTIDENFLPSIEKKYELNLWKITLNERLFYRFFDFYKFSRKEILSIEEQIIRLYEKILDDIKPDYLMIKLPHLHHQDLLIKICRKKGIKILMLNLSLIGPGSLLMQNSNKYDEIENFDSTSFNMMSFEQCNSFLKGTKENMTRTAIKEKKINLKILRIFFKFLFSNNNKINTNYDYYGRTKLKVIRYEINQLIKKFFRKKFIDQNLKMNVDLSTPFIYFPLNVDMERAILMDAPYYTNHVETIRSVAKSIPINYLLYVKEHPAQIMRDWRQIREYKDILEIPNVIFLHPNFPTEKLYENCKAVISIAGTSGFEAAVFKKPSIILTDLRYDFLPSISKCKSLEYLPEIIQESILKNVNYEDISKYFYFIKSIVCEFNWGKFNSDFNNEFYPDENFDVNIDENKLKVFLNKYESDLLPIVQAHIKKINFFEKS